jgi:hypothetical protein
MSRKQIAVLPAIGCGVSSVHLVPADSGNPG